MFFIKSGESVENIIEMQEMGMRASLTMMHTLVIEPSWFWVRVTQMQTTDIVHFWCHNDLSSLVQFKNIYTVKKSLHVVDYLWEDSTCVCVHVCVCVVCVRSCVGVCAFVCVCVCDVVCKQAVIDRPALPLQIFAL